MGRTPCCTKVGLNRGPWTPEEDLRLANYIKTQGEGGWRTLPKKAGLLRCGKSCRLRWMNYLRPDVKRGHILPEEEDLILRLHRLLGNRWSLIAGRMPGRTDNEIKNYWNTHLSKKLISQGIDPRTHKPLSESEDIWSNPEDSDTIPNHCLQGISQYTPTPANVNPEDTYPSELVKNPENCNHRQSEFNEIPAASQNRDHAVSIALKSCLDDPTYPNNKPFPPPIVKSGVMGTPYVFGESSTCFPRAIHDSDQIRGAHQISYPPSTTACSESSEVVADRHIRSCDITSTVGDSGLHSAPYFGQYNSTHVLLPTIPSLGKTQVPQNIQSQEMALNYSDTLAIDATFNKLSNTNCGAANQVTAFSLPYSVPATPVGTPFGDANSEMFSSFLESFMNEELHLPEPSTAQGHNFVPQIVQLRQNQLGPENLSYELLSTPHTSTAHYRPSG